MNHAIHDFLGALLRITRLEFCPVRVRSGLAAGARWTVYPWSSYWRGVHESALHHALLELGGMTGWTCWDLGAHFGIYAIGLGRRVGPAGEIAAFEPNPRSHARLQHHRDMNDLHWVRTFEAAVSDVAGPGQLYTYGDLQGTTNHLPYETEIAPGSSHAIQVRTVVLDSLVRSGAIRGPQLIKVDVEGHGHRALAGAKESLHRFRPIVIAALHSPPERDGILSLLQPLGYTWHPVGGRPGDAIAIGQDVWFNPPVRPAPAGR